MTTEKLLKLTIARVDESVFDGDVISVNVPGAAGEMTILADHAALVSPLRTGVIAVTKTDGTTQTFPVTTGTIEISGNHATILV